MKRILGTRIEINDINQPAIVVKNLHKSFRLPTEQSFGLKQAIFNRLRGIKGYKVQKVLKGLDFEIKKGEFVGIVGRNGSGKSTLLKILAGTYYPEKGSVVVNGDLVPFIELGVGFNPELTGRENVYMNGALLGFSNKEMDAMYDDIWDFAELKEFQDQKLKNYSSGMQVRLAFSIAIRAHGDILLLDEVLAVGDTAFQRKCFNYFSELKKAKQTVILVTHSMESVQSFCTRAIMIEDGKIIADGSPLKVARKYLESNNRAIEKDNNNKNGVTAYIKASAKNTITKDKINLSFDITPTATISDLVIAIGVKKIDGEQIYRWASDERIEKEITLIKDKTYHLEITAPNYFPHNKYNVDLIIRSMDRVIDYGSFFGITNFNITSDEIGATSNHWRLPESFKLTDYQ